MNDDRESLIMVLRELEEILLRSDHPGQADYVSAVATIAEWDRTASPPLLLRGMWGGRVSCLRRRKIQLSGGSANVLESLAPAGETKRGSGVSE